MLKITYRDGTFAIVQENGHIIEHSIPTERAAAERLTFHTERAESIRRWDDSHRG
jgi:hypothetical protein